MFFLVFLLRSARCCVPCFRRPWPSCVFVFCFLLFFVGFCCVLAKHKGTACDVARFPPSGGWWLSGIPGAVGPHWDSEGKYGLAYSCCHRLSTMPTFSFCCLVQGFVFRRGLKEELVSVRRSFLLLRSPCFCFWRRWVARVGWAFLAKACYSAAQLLVCCRVRVLAFGVGFTTLFFEILSSDCSNGSAPIHIATPLVGTSS